MFRRAILDAAEHVFAARGFSDAKMMEIARAAGMAAGTIYNYFDSKEAVLRALMEQRGHDLLQKLETAAHAGPRGVPALQRLLAAVFEHAEAHGGIFALMHEISDSPEGAMRRVCGAPGERLIGQFHAVFERAIGEAARAGAIRRDMPARDLVLFLTGGARAFLHSWFLGGGRGHIARRAPAVVDLFLQGAAPR